MTLLIRFILVSLIVYLLIRSFTRYSNASGESQQQKTPENKDPKNERKISKRVGEYIDYEEVEK